MPVQRVSTSQFADIIAAGILGRDGSFPDLGPGEVADLVVNPQAAALALQHRDIQQVGAMLSLSDASIFTGYELDLEGIAFNEGLTRDLGGQATTTATFYRSTPPTVDLPVPRGFPIGTLPDASTGLAITFVTSEAAVMLAASAASFFNITLRRYELTVPVVAIVEGTSSQAGAGRLTRPLRPLAGFTGVTNTRAASGGVDLETNQQLIDRNLIAVIGRELATPNGAKRVVLDDFSGDVDDVYLVYGTNPLLTRAGDTAGAVDAYIIGNAAVEQTESPHYLGANQLIPIAFAPLNEVLSVRDLSTGTTFVEGTDFDVVYDLTGVGNSQRAQDGVRFRPGGSAPAIGRPVTITYTYNSTIRRLQAEFELDTALVFGRDLLFREGTAVPISLAASLKVAGGFSSSLVLAADRAAILAFFAGLGLGDPVQGSDLQGVVRQVTGNDNFIITRLTESATPSGTADIDLVGNEYPTLASADLVIGFI